MKSPEEILKARYWIVDGKPEKNEVQVSSLFYDEIIECMNEYADQFRNPPKKTIEERKQEFEFLATGASLGMPSSELKLFIDYWTEHGLKDRKMRFEKEKSFDIFKRIARWMNNKKQPHGRKSADQAIGELLSD